MLTPEQLAEIEAHNYRPYLRGAAATRQADLAAVDIPALLADVRQLTEDRDRLFEERNRALDALTVGSKDILLANLTDAEADRDRAREIAIALEQQLAEIERLAYIGGQTADDVRRWIIGVFENARRDLEGGE